MRQHFDSTISKFTLALGRNDSDLGCDQAIMFNAPVAGKIEHGFLAKSRRSEIAIVDKKLIVLRLLRIRLLLEILIRRLDVRAD
jgi:hypothetical protein